MSAKPKKPHGPVALDVQDQPLFLSFAWERIGSQGYVYRRTRYAKGVRRQVYLLHREIMRPSPEMVVDHISGDVLDNRRSNLRVCTSTENNRNKNTRRRELPKGVYLQKGLYRARLPMHERRLSLGLFKTAWEAAEAYNAAAKLHYGEFARINDAQEYPHLTAALVSGLAP